MPKKIEIDLEKIKELHAQGLSDREIGEKLGGCSATIRTRRIQLGLAPGRRGPRASTSTNVRKPGIAKATRKTAKIAIKNNGEAVTLCLTGAALDAIWRGLQIETKARLIELLTE